MTTHTSSDGSGRSTLAIALALTAMFAFAVMDGLTKTLSLTLPIPQILWVRNIVFCVLIVGLMRAQGQPLRALLQSKRPGLQLARALLLICESSAFMLAFKFMPLADVHAVAALAPLAVVALSVPLLGEQVGWRRWCAVAAGFVGVMLIVRPGFQKIEPAMLIALAAAGLWAAYQIMVRLCSRSDSSDTTSLWTAMIGFLATSLVGPAMWQWPDATGWWMLAAIAMLGSLAHICFIRALSLTQPSLLQPYTYTLFVWAVIVGYAFFGDVPDAWTWAGASIIIASGIYVWHRERVRNAAGVV
jgi:drug/metabolite transporter (DMT)-like permease